MTKKLYFIVSIVAALVLVGVGVWAYSKNQNQKSEPVEMATEKTSENGTNTTQPTVAQDGDAMSTHGSYVTLASFNSDPTKYADTKKVYFFHASWCPICQSIDKEISTDMSKIPVGVTLIKTDFDSAIDLRKKYGVTTQYTFVQVDNSGNETAQWSATSLAKAIAGIKS